MLPMYAYVYTNISLPPARGRSLMTSNRPAGWLIMREKELDVVKTYIPVTIIYFIFKKLS